VLCLRDGQILCHGPPSEITPEVIRQTFGTETALYAHHHAHR
jgi:hypothetical protein